MVVADTKTDETSRKRSPQMLSELYLYNVFSFESRVICVVFSWSWAFCQCKERDGILCCVSLWLCQASEDSFQPYSPRFKTRSADRTVWCCSCSSDMFRWTKPLDRAVLVISIHFMLLLCFLRCICPLQPLGSSPVRRLLQIPWTMIKSHGDLRIWKLQMTWLPNKIWRSFELRRSQQNSAGWVVCCNMHRLPGNKYIELYWWASQNRRCPRAQATIVVVGGS